MDVYTGDDFYCDVALPRAVPLDVIHEDDSVLVFHHTRPFWDVHIVAVPKKHIPSLTAAGPGDHEDLEALFLAVQSMARDVEREHGAAAVATNLGAYQDSKHLHVHIHSGARRNAGTS
jgi:histidine triad (HIT) family protein